MAHNMKSMKTDELGINMHTYVGPKISAKSKYVSSPDLQFTYYQSTVVALHSRPVMISLFHDLMVLLVK